MGKNNQASLTDRNLDRLAEFLNCELEQPTLAAQIPSGAHLFYGSYSDATLTQSNLQMVSKTLLGITLGYIKDAPLIMMFECEPGRQMVIDLSSEAQKDEARMLVEGFQEQSRYEMIVRINELVLA